jgi:hypothetical protein
MHAAAILIPELARWLAFTLPPPIQRSRCISVGRLGQTIPFAPLFPAQKSKGCWGVRHIDVLPVTQALAADQVQRAVRIPVCQEILDVEIGFHVEHMTPFTLVLSRRHADTAQK